MSSWQPCDKHKDNKKKKKDGCINVNINININICGKKRLCNELVDAVKDGMGALTEDLEALNAEDNEEEIDDDEEEEIDD
ncbi:MAG: hypothetical protein ACYC2T_01745 [Bacillota bacterium]